MYVKDLGRLPFKQGSMVSGWTTKSTHANEPKQGGEGQLKRQLRAKRISERKQQLICCHPRLIAQAQWAAREWMSERTPFCI